MKRRWKHVFRWIIRDDHPKWKGVNSALAWFSSSSAVETEAVLAEWHLHRVGRVHEWRCEYRSSGVSGREAVLFSRSPGLQSQSSLSILISSSQSLFFPFHAPFFHQSVYCHSLHPSPSLPSNVTGWLLWSLTSCVSQIARSDEYTTCTPKNLFFFLPLITCTMYSDSWKSLNVILEFHQHCNEIQLPWSCWKSLK